MVAPSKYYIRSLAQPDLVLEAYEGNAVVGWIDPSFTDQKQQWFRMPYSSSSVLTNVATGTQLTAATLDRGTLLTLGSGTEWTFKNGDETCVVQPKDSDTQVMNLLGPDFNLGSPVGLWTWSRGQSNELWRFDEVGIIERYRTDEAYVVPGNPNVALKAAADGRVFVGDYTNGQYDDAMLWTITYWTSGISFKNKETGLWLAYGGPDQPLVQNIQMANQSVFTPANDHTTWWRLGYWADPNLTMRTFSASGRPANNDTVGVAPWAGDEVWSIWVRAADGQFVKFTPHPRDTHVVG
jgi:hypothetical protein